jgi:hypothetical protein
VNYNYNQLCSLNLQGDFDFDQEEADFSVGVALFAEINKN